MFKKIATVATILSFSLFFTACEKEASTTTPTPDKTQKALIVGKWNYRTSLVNQFSNGSTKSDPYTYTAGEYIQFNADGTGRDFNTTFKYKLEGKFLTLVLAPYTFNGVPYEEDTVTCEVQEINANKLTLYYDYSGRSSAGVKTGNEVYDYLSR